MNKNDVMRKWFEAALKWLYLDTADYLKMSDADFKEIQKVRLLSEEFISDVTFMRAAFRELSSTSKKETP